MAWCSEGPGLSPRTEAGIGYGRPEFDLKAALAKAGMVNEQLIKSAAMVARASPEYWGLFVNALEARAIEASEHLVSSSPGDLQINQGRAQAYLFMFKLCRDAIKQQEEIDVRKQNG